MTATDITFATSPCVVETTYAALSRIEDVARITLADIAGLDSNETFVTSSF